MRMNLKSLQYFTGCKIIAVILTYRWAIDLINLNYNRVKIIDPQVLFRKFLKMSIEHSLFFVIHQSVCIMA